jgi:hypothetical protein
MKPVPTSPTRVRRPVTVAGEGTAGGEGEDDTADSGILDEPAPNRNGGVAAPPPR